MSEHLTAGNVPKRKYRTLAEAEEARERMDALFGVALRIYLCPFCDQYHLGSSNKIAHERLRRAMAGEPPPLDLPPGPLEPIGDD